MDTSKQYIKMCEAANEIQVYGADHLKELRPLYCWDDMLQRISMYMWMPKSLATKLGMDTNEIIISIEEGRERNIWYPPQKGSIIWLPRQDQLQEMSGLSWIDFDIACIKLVSRTKEQAGIKVVMKEKYGKTWDGEQWMQ